MHDLLAAIDTTSLLGLRDRALIALMGYTFARVGAAAGMKVEDFCVQKRRGWVRLNEKGGKVTELPCHHNLGPVFGGMDCGVPARRRTRGPALPYSAEWPADRSHSPAPGHVHMMTQRRARTAGLRTKIGAHSFRATGITTYLQNGGKLEIAQQMAGHE